MKKLEGTSMDIIQDNINRLIEIFPEIFTEGKVDFEALKQLLGERIENDRERYSFTWKGKTEARQIAQEVSTGTLRPSKEDSKDWNNTENLYIEGDNLEVLKLLQKSYHGKIKMIYIDPPYNTGKDFVYKDNFKDNLKNYLEITGQVGEEGQKLTTNSDSNGRYHSDWLNMMYPRLKLARNLLTDDGVIFISIDDNEQENLKKVCNEIFGENNFLGILIQNKLNSKSDTLNIQRNHEYILVYRKNEIIKDGKISATLIFQNDDIKQLEYDGNNYYFLGDSITTRGDGGTLNSRKNLGYTIYYNPTTKNFFAEQDYDIEKALISNIEEEVYNTNTEHLIDGYIVIRPPKVRGKLGAWTWDISKFNNNKEKIYIKETKNGFSVHKRNIVSSEEVFFTNKIPYFKKKILSNSRSILEYSTNDGTDTLNSILELGIFNNPKNMNMLKYFLKLAHEENFIILDFFSGSGTTAHAVMQLNAEDGGNRKYIMVQMPEPCDEKSEAYKAGYKNICEIGKARIKKAGEKIKTDETLPVENREKLDTGFKVFKLDSSNIKEWDSETEDLSQSLFNSIDNIKSNRISLDILYEVLLKYGLDLNVPIKEKENFYSIGGGTLLINLDKEIDMKIIDSICKEYQNLLEIDEDFKTTVIFRDSSFKNDIDKTNALKKLEQVGIKEVRSI